MEALQAHGSGMQGAEQGLDPGVADFLNTLNDGVYLQDTRGYVLFVNRVMEQWFGIPFHHFQGRHITDFFAVEAGIPFETDVEKDTAGKPAPPRRLEMVTADGDPLTVQVDIHPVYKDGTVVCLQGVCRDLTGPMDGGEVHALKKTCEGLEEKLRSRSRELEDVHIALTVLMGKRAEERAELEESILFNIKKVAEPYLEKLKQSGLTRQQYAYVSILESNLGKVAASFSRQLSSNSLRLTPTEILVADLIREGKGNKEIAALLGVSARTIGSHRESIRGKLGLKHRKADLRTYLLSFR
jgi:PAS domain S-box-containing protein